MNTAGSETYRYCDNSSDLLNSIRVEEIYPATPEKSWFVLNNNTSVQDALQFFQEHNLRAVPIRNIVTGDCMGFVDVLDIVGYLAALCSQPLTSSSDSVPLISSIADLELPVLLNVFERFCKEEIGRLVDFEKRNPFIPVPVGQTLYFVLANLKTYASLEIQRVPIVEESINKIEKPRIVGIVSQTRILQYIAAHISVLGKWGEIPIRELFSNLEKEVVSIRPYHKALDGFFLMHTRQLSSVAVINDQGALVANLSTSDLRGITHMDFHKLFMPVVDFIKEIHKKRNLIMTPPVTITPNTSIETLIMKLACTGVRRAYIIDNEFKPRGIISINDVMNVLID